MERERERALQKVLLEYSPEYWSTYACEQATHNWGKNYLKGAGEIIPGGYVRSRIVCILTSQNLKTKQNKSTAIYNSEILCRVLRSILL